jgi:hypothetical protein
MGKGKKLWRGGGKGKKKMEAVIAVYEPSASYE